MLFDEALHYLLSLGHETLAMKLGLENTERLLDALARPQEAFPSVQIAGTNGKGSTAAMLAAILRAAGIKTGLYTSPHLVSITERIRTDGAEIAPEEFARWATETRAAAEWVERATGALPTFFEQVTAIALLAFRASDIELAILETGMGGRLDATTVARAATVAITPIALDHQEHLGQTLAAIAAEKAAIIRPGVTAIVAAAQPAEALAVIERRCRECGVSPRFAARDIETHEADERGRLRATFRTPQGVYENVRLSLRGRHQLANASVAIAIAESLRERGFQIPRASIVAGLEQAEHAGRLELLPGSPPLLLDGAHNAASARVLGEYLAEFVRPPLTLVFGAMRDKDLNEIAAPLFSLAHRIILTQPRNPRAASLAALAQAVPPGFDSSKITHAPTVAEALHRARELSPPDGTICITGSLYLVGEAKRNLKTVTSDE